MQEKKQGTSQESIQEKQQGTSYENRQEKKQATEEEVCKKGTKELGQKV